MIRLSPHGACPSLHCDVPHGWRGVVIFGEWWKRHTHGVAPRGEAIEGLSKLMIEPRRPGSSPGSPSNFPACVQTANEDAAIHGLYPISCNYETAETKSRVGVRESTNGQQNLSSFNLRIRTLAAGDSFPQKTGSTPAAPQNPRQAPQACGEKRGWGRSVSGSTLRISTSRGIREVEGQPSTGDLRGRLAERLCDSSLLIPPKAVNLSH